MSRILPLLLPLALVACDVDQAADAVHQELKTEERVAFEDSLELRLQTLGERIAVIDAQLERATTAPPPELVEESERLEADFVDLGERWLEVEEATNPRGWSFMAESLRKDVDDLEYRADQLDRDLSFRVATVQ